MSQPFASRIPYGARRNLPEVGATVRSVARTFGRTRFLTYSPKGNGLLAVESDAERLVAHMLTLDPRVKRIKAQPFMVDLIDERLCRTTQDVAESRARHKRRGGQKFYTPDFAVEWHGHPRTALEVKLENYLGDESYAAKLARGQQVLEACGYPFFQVVVPADPRHPVRANLVLLNNAALRPDTWPSAEEACAIVSACGEEGAKLGWLCRHLGLSPSMAPSWLVSGVVRADLFRHAINGELHLQPAYGGLCHLELFPEMTR